MKKQSLVLILVGGIVGCSKSGGGDLDMGRDVPPEPVEKLRLPSSGANHSICEENDISYLSGGDVNEVAQRIVVGEVNSIEFIEVDDRTGCTQTGFSWTLRVGVQISQAVKGEAGEVLVNLRPQFLYWSSEPIRREGEQWLPDWPDSPKIEVSDELGWSGDTGLQVGQEVALFLMETDGMWHTGKIPWANYSEGLITFPINEVNGCQYLPESWHEGVTLEELEADLQSGPRDKNQSIRNTLLDVMPPTKSFCSQPIMPLPPQDMGFD